MYGILFRAQRLAARKYLRGKLVHDLGCGDLSLSYDLLRLGAKRVVAIDKEPCPKPLDPRIETIRAMFRDVDASPEVAFLSYPPNYWLEGLIELLERSRTVLYLGCNTGGTACGTEPLFRHFLKREMLAYEPMQKNTLIIYGPYDPARVMRAPRGEEIAGIERERLFDYAEVERATPQSTDRAC